MQAPSLEVIRKASYRASPWKNGGGVTHEAIRVPPDGAFRWRVSVAHIGASGPFSHFPQYHRHMVLLQGAGLELRFGDDTQRSLREVGDRVEFDGGMAAHCTLLNGPCVDLNLMVSKADRVDARVERFLESLAVDAAPDETLLIFGMDKRFQLETGAKTVDLDPWDLAVLSHGRGRLGSDESAAFTSVFLATLKFASGQ